ncbi:hypothetical protein [Streptomyces sp. NPDC059009]|uniref:hypothetical protein n=1 Tax=Streptomyces sp. NPDC059009 TaxID=3346694 RepID=UPI0036A70442
MTHNGPALYARSRALPLTLATLAAAAALAAWGAYWVQEHLGYGGNARIPVVVLAPLLAASAIGTGLHSHSDDLDRTAARPWWPRRTVQLLALTALSAGLLALAVPGHPERYGAPALVRNLLGDTGLAAASAALVGARLSWLPVTVYGSAVYLAAPREPGGASAVWAWPMQPGPQGAAWAVAVGLFAVGGVLYASRGARPEESGPRA